MHDIIILTHQQDIPGCKMLVPKFSSYSILIFDPVLLDQAILAGLNHTRLIIWENPPAYAERNAQAHAAAFQLESELNSAVRDLLPETSIESWQHLRWYYFFLTISWYSPLWETLGHHFTDCSLHILVCDQPLVYYFNSFVPSWLLIQYAAKHRIPFTTYSYGATINPPCLIPDLGGQAPEADAGFLLTHLPSCIYDIAYFNEEISSTGKPSVNIQSTRFDVPTFATRNIGFIPMEKTEGLSQELLNSQLTPFANRITSLLSDRITSHMGLGRFTQAQVDIASTHYLLQLLTYLKLNDHFRLSRPSHLLLSDHDTDFHGPLVSFARLHQVPITLLPHSKVTYDIAYKDAGMTALTHSIQGGDILDGNNRLVTRFAIRYPSKSIQLSPTKARLQKIGILLNAISLNGVYFCDYQAYLVGLKTITSWCRLHNLAVDIRGKPNYTLLHALAAELEIPIADLFRTLSRPLSEFADNCDLCLMFGAPTSAAIELFSRSLPILNPIQEPLARPFLVGTPPDLIPRESVEKTLERLSLFQSDPALFIQFRAEQFAKYKGLLQSANPLRSYL